MSSKNKDVYDIPVEYTYTGHSSDNDPDALKLTRDTSLVVPNDDANDKTIACSARRIKKAREYLFDVKNEAEKLTGLKIDLCSLVFGITATLLATIWTSISLYTKKGLVLYAVLLLLLAISFFMWFLLKRIPHININASIKAILDDLPDPEKTQSIKRKP